MSTDAAATLTLRIDTVKAAADLEALETRYRALRSALGAPSGGGTGLTQLGTDAKAAEQHVKVLNASIATLQSKLSESGTGGKSGILGNITQKGTEAQGVFGMLDKSIERTNSNLKIMLKSAEMTGSAIIKAGDAQIAAAARLKAIQETRDKQVFDAEVAKYAQRNKLIEALDLERYEAAGRAAARLKAIQETRDKQVFDAEVAKYAQRNKLIEALDLERYEAAGRAAARLKAIQEKRDIDAYNSSVAAFERQLAMERKYILASEETRIKGAIAARKLMDSGYRGNLAAEFAPQTLSLARSASVSALEAQLGVLAATHTSLGTATRKSATDQLHWNTIANEAHGVARGLSGALGGLWLTYGSIAPLVAAAVVAGSMKEMVTAGKELEFQFTVVKAISGGTAVDLQKFNEAVTGTMSTPLEAAKGLRVLAQAGLSVEEATSALPSVLKLAAVGETDMANAALAATSIMHSFGLTVNDFGHIGDVFAKAAAISATSVKEMMEAMKQASAISNMFGVSMEEAAASLATLANRGIEGSASGTAVTNMVRELSAPATKRATEALKQMGIEIYNADGSLKPFTERLQQLSEATSGMTEKGKTRFLEDIFNNRAVKAANILLSDMTKFNSALEEIRMSSEGLGFMTDAQIKIGLSTEGALKSLQSDFQKTLASVFDGIQPQIAGVVQSLASIVNSSELKGFFEGIAKAAVTLTQVLLDNLDTIKLVLEVYLSMKAVEVASAAFVLLAKNIGLVTQGLKVLATVDMAATAANAVAAAQTAAAATAAAAASSSTVVASQGGLIATMLANLGTIAKGLLGPFTLVATGLGVLIAAGFDWSRSLSSMSEEGERGVNTLNKYAESTRKVSQEVSKGVDALYASGVALKEQIRLMGAGKDAADAYAASIRNAPALMANEALDKSKEILDRAKARYAAGPQGGGDATAESREARQLLNDLTEAQKAHDKVLENHSKVLNDVTKANAMAAEQGYDKQLIKQAEAARGLNEQWEKMKRDGTDAEKLLASKSYAVGLSAEQAEATRKRLQQLADQKNKTANLKPLADDPNKELASSAELLARRQQLQAVLSDYEPKKAETAARTQKRYVDNQKKLDDSRIKGLVEAQQFEIQLLESKRSNHLISEDEFQKELAAIYKKNEKEIEESYGASLIRLTQLARAAQGDQKVQADRLLQDEWNAYNKYESDRTLRLQKATDRNLGIVKKGHEDTLKFIAEQEVAVKQLQDKLTETRLKLDMTPAQSAGYDARRDSEKATDKFIAKKQSDINAQLKMSPEVPVEENNVLKAMLEDLDKLYEAKERLAAQSASIAEQEVEFQRSYEFGWKNAYKNWADDATNAAKQAADSFSVMSSAIDKALTDFLTTGKVNFAEFAKSIILEIAKIEAKALWADATKGSGGFGGIVKGILGMLGMGGGGFSSGDFANLAASHIDSAKGNVFSGSPSLHQYANTVQTSPVTFSFDKLHKFARGGVFAEAGPEAVMPLSRDSAGRLGVKAQGGGRTYNITVNVNGNNNAQDVRRAAGQGAREAASFISAAHRYV